MLASRILRSTTTTTTTKTAAAAATAVTAATKTGTGRVAPRLSLPVARFLIPAASSTTASTTTSTANTRPFSTSTRAMATAADGSFDKPVANLTTDHAPKLPDYSSALFGAKKNKALTFEQIGKELGRDEVAVAAIFYGQAKASAQDVQKLSQLLDLPHDLLVSSMYGWPDRGRSIEMPPKEPLMYRLYEIVQNYGYAYKAVLNEKFGDGIMSAISFSTNVKKETDDKGDWVVITLRGKWLPYTRF